LVSSVQVPLMVRSIMSLDGAEPSREPGLELRPWWRPREPAALHVQREDLDREDQAMGWLRAEHQVLMRMISYAASEGFGSHAWQPPGL
jgi:hypothetical protein